MPKIGLALSGGGFRGTLYHLGVIRFLRDAQILPDVTHITSVSGGSILAASRRRIPVVGYAASRIKKSLTGSGRAPKEQMQAAIRTELCLDRLPEPHDVADACAVALCHYQIARNRRILDGLR